MSKTVLCTIEQYKYLGLVLNEFLHFNITAQVLSDAANRALGSIINKYMTINGLGYYTCTRLFQSGVCPTLDYGSEIWGFRHFDQVDSIQNKAIRIYLGVHRFIPTAVINGDMGWTHSSVRRKVCMVCLWNIIINLDPQRLHIKVLEWEIHCNGNTWSSNLKSILSSMDLSKAFNTRNIVCTRAAWSSLHEIYCNQCQQDVLDKPKLRTYVNFKVSYNVEDYVM